MVNPSSPFPSAPLPHDGGSREGGGLSFGEVVLVEFIENLAP